MPSGASTGGPAATAGVTGPGNRGVFAAFITRGYFSYVALNYADTAALDYQLTKDLNNSGHYRIVAVIPYGTEVPPIGQGTYVVWQHEDQP
jgi:hypothetical protein